MKIIGGSFGLKGSAWISRDDHLVVKGDKEVNYPRAAIASMNARQDKERRFGWGSFLIGMLVFGVIFNLLLPGIGLLIALALSIAGSYYTTREQFVEVAFTDGKQVTLQCTPRGVKKLMRFAPA